MSLTSVATTLARRELAAATRHAARHVHDISCILSRNEAISECTSCVKTHHPVVLVHGFLSQPGALTPWAEILLDHGFDVHNFSYPSRGRTISQLTTSLANGLKEVAANHGGTVSCIGHSLGGVLLRGALLSGAATCVRSCVTVCSPHKGTPWADHARRIPHTSVVTEMSSTSATVKSFGQHNELNNVRWTAIAAKNDIVVPAFNAALDVKGAKNHLIHGEGHLSVVESALVAGIIVTELEEAGGCHSLPHRL